MFKKNYTCKYYTTPNFSLKKFQGSKQIFCIFVMEFTARK